MIIIFITILWLLLGYLSIKIYLKNKVDIPKWFFIAGSIYGLLTALAIISIILEEKNKDHDYKK